MNKTAKSTIVLLGTILFSVSLFSQSYPLLNVSVEEESDRPLFRPKTSIVDLLPNISFSSLKTDQNNAVTTNNTFNMNLRGNYYPWDLSDKIGGNLGIVAGIHYRNLSTKTEGIDNKNSQGFFVFEAGVQYGIYLGNVPLRAELTGGIGNYRPSSDFKATSTALNFNVATYVPLGNSGAFVMPYVGYGTVSNRFTTEDSFIDKVCVNGMLFGASIVRPMGCGDEYCGFGDRVLPDLYGKGTNQSTLLQNGLLGIGNAQTTFKDFDDLGENKVSGYDVQLAHYYFPLNNFGVGAGLMINGNTIAPKADKEDKTTNSSITFMPMVRYHAPLENQALNNLFVDGGVGFGTTTNKFKDFQGNEVKNSNSIFNWEIGLGYNMPFSDQFSVIGTFHYVNSTSTNKEDSEKKTTSSGTRLMIGLAYRWGS